ncbi:MAG: hypothetical protein NVS3B28_05360 [Candidatus Velthaea sp.]
MLRILTAFILVVCGALATSGAVRAADPAEVSATDAARAKVAAGDTLGAIRDLDSYVPAHPADISAARLLGDLYYRIPDYKGSERIWKTILVRVPSDRETHNRLGSLYAAQDRIEDAIAEFEKSLPSRGGFYGLVAEHRRLGDLRAFESIWQQKAESNPFNAGAQSFYGSILRAERRFTAAQPYFNKVVTLSGANCGAMIDAGNNYIDTGALTDALVLLERCLRLQPGNYDALVDAGEAYLEKDDLKRARTYFERAVAARPAGSEALVDIGYLEDVNGHWKEAIGFYVRAVNSDPLQAAAYIDLGYDYNEHQLYQLAEASLIKGLSVAPEDGRLHYLLAVTYNVQGKVTLARSQYRLAVDSQEPIVVRAAQAELALLPPAK